ncbi:DUF1573 domain-containing protein [Negadavirga shengliensis]|uniref:DUF1573 domain-containing protein n=1 Tax=Negadavirga shengliensis TaxID=1389218 RepID=A0ABV9T1E0_9BACT
MEKQGFSVYMCILIWFVPLVASSQVVGNSPLVWENNIINLGAVLEENGEATAEFYFVNKADFPVYVEDVITDCGCTAAEYTTDTLFKDKIGLVKVRFDPQSRGGSFSKMVLVRTNIDTDGDSLFLEGINVPMPGDVQKHYKVNKEGLGFALPVINLGTVFTDKPKVKPLDFYNFNDYPVQLNQVQQDLPEHIKVRMIPAVAQPKSRAVLEITYDPAMAMDLGFLQEEFKLSLLTFEKKDITLNLVTTVHEHFDPVPVTEIDNQPKLRIKENEVDLQKIRASNSVSRIITMENAGAQPLNIRKIVTNCGCLSYDVPKYDLEVGEKMDLVLTFDPRGRRGIDHKTLTIFSNDPLNPTQTVVIKSRIN